MYFTLLGKGSYTLLYGVGSFSYERDILEYVLLNSATFPYCICSSKSVPFTKALSYGKVLVFIYLIETENVTPSLQIWFNLIST